MTPPLALPPYQSEPISAIEAELSAPVLTPQQKRLQKRKITSSTIVSPKRFLFRWRGISCMPRGELVAVGGKAKSGKTFFNSLLISTAISKEVGSILGISRIEADPLRVVWIDTEQSEDSTQEILVNRILPLSGQADEHQVQVFNLRIDNWQDRWGLAETAIREYQPDLVLLDGIRDFIGDINDYEQAQSMLDQLLALASDVHACLICVLHENKADEDHNLRGAIGTELMNKAFEAYTCKKDPEAYYFTVTQSLTRKYDIRQKLQFTVNEQGLPVAYSSMSSDADTNANQAPQNQFFYKDEQGRARVDFYSLFREILRGGQFLTPSEMLQASRRFISNMSERWMEQLIGYACEKRVIRSVETLPNVFAYTLA